MTPTQFPQEPGPENGVCEGACGRFRPRVPVFPTTDAPCRKAGAFAFAPE